MSEALPLLAPSGAGYALGTAVRHPQVRLHTPDGLEIEVDVLVVPLLAQLWRRGIATDWSCQGEPEHPGYVVVRPLASAVRCYSALLACGELSGLLDEDDNDGPSWASRASCSSDLDAFEDPSADRVCFRVPHARLAPCAQALAMAPLVPQLTAAHQALVETQCARWQQQLADHRERQAHRAALLADVSDEVFEVAEYGNGEGLLVYPDGDGAYWLDEDGRLSVFSDVIEPQPIDWRRDSLSERAHRKRIEALLWYAHGIFAFAEEADADAARYQSRAVRQLPEPRAAALVAFDDDLDWVS